MSIIFFFLKLHKQTSNFRINAKEKHTRNFDRKKLTQYDKFTNFINYIDGKLSFQIPVTSYFPKMQHSASEPVNVRAIRPCKFLLMENIWNLLGISAWWEKKKKKSYIFFGILSKCSSNCCICIDHSSTRLRRNLSDILWEYHWQHDLPFALISMHYFLVQPTITQMSKIVFTYMYLYI